MANMLEAMGMQHAAFYVRDGLPVKPRRPVEGWYRVLVNGCRKFRYVSANGFVSVDSDVMSGMLWTDDAYDWSTAERMVSAASSVELVGWDEWVDEDPEARLAAEEADGAPPMMGEFEDRNIQTRGWESHEAGWLHVNWLNITTDPADAPLDCRGDDEGPEMMSDHGDANIKSYGWEDCTAAGIHANWLNITTDPSEAPDDCDPWALPDGWDWDWDRCGWHAIGPGNWCIVGNTFRLDDPVAESVRQLVIERNR
jgi:hypothetical protein